jgi:membrane-associated phospholipid phosphatase
VSAPSERSELAHIAANVPVPGEDHLGPLIARFDRWTEGQLERWRGDPITDMVFTSASRLGEFSTIWHLAGIARGLTGAARLRQVPVLAALLGAESVLVNQGIKRLVRRTRPTSGGDDRFALRTPLTSSFPSGHASSAAMAATVLTFWDGRRSIPLWWGLAAIVATSRAYVRVHHASDVVGGLATGRVLGLIARRIVRRTG